MTTSLELPPAAAANDSARAVFEVLGTARAMRHLLPDPVDPGLIESLIWAATRASNPDNTQMWEFIVITEPSRRRELAAAVQPVLESVATLPPPRDQGDARIRRDAHHLIAHLDEVPVVIAICGRNEFPPGAPQERYLWSALFPAAQNMIVAARSLGLGAVLTMLHVGDPRAVRDMLGLPAGTLIGALVAVGHPGRPFGPVGRRPIAEVVHHERW